ncbi:MAG: hypothetical protein AD742_04145 [Methylibium sp. NZG]|nr:MAG: hypothetical protein AD742_04145 [Methylibium sp. NZG]
MKTTFDLPEALLRRAKAAAAHQGRPLRDLVAEAIDAKLAAESALSGAATPKPALPDHGWKAFSARLVKQDDGSWVNPDGIDDERFFEALEDIRAESRRVPFRDPFADFLPEELAPPDLAPPDAEAGHPPAAAAPEKPAARPCKATAAVAAAAVRKRRSR